MILSQETCLETDWPLFKDRVRVRDDGKSTPHMVWAFFIFRRG